MMSIRTNSAAISALAGLRSISDDMARTQDQIATGRRVASAGDNSAYWSIATTMRSDTKALTAVDDALNLSTAMVDVAYTGMTASRDLLDEIKARLVAASEPGVDRGKIQKEISSLQNQLQTIAQSSSFNGENWLSANATLASSLSTSLVSGFTRDADGRVNLQKTEVNLSHTVLFNMQGGGALETAISTDESAYTTMGFASTLKSQLESAPQPASSGSLVDSFTVNQGDEIAFDIRKGAQKYSVFINRATVNAALGAANQGEISNASDMLQVFNKALSNAGVPGGTVTASVTTVFQVGSVFAVTGVSAGTTISGVRITEAVPPSQQRDAISHPTIGVLEMDITGANVDLDDYLSQMEVMLDTVTNAAADLGSLQSRLSLQQGFTKDLVDALDRGIGTLVDADMNEASTRLKALQTQQQLGIQALSIANAGTQNVLQLFR